MFHVEHFPDSGDAGEARYREISPMNRAKQAKSAWKGAGLGALFPESSIRRWEDGSDGL